MSQTLNDKLPLSAPHRSEQPWTAQRCNRLLRPLSAKIAALRHSKTSVSGIFYSSPQDHNPDGFFESVSVPSNISLSGPVLGTGSPQRTRLKTYLSRKRGARHQQNSATEACTPSRVYKNDEKIPYKWILPTPLVSRLCTRESDTLPASSQASVHHLHRTHTENQKATQPRRKYRMYAAQDSRSLFTGAFNAFTNLMDATDPVSATTADSRSLLSICLRQIPAFIEDEIWYRVSVDKDDKSDVIAEVYEAINQLSTAPNSAHSGYCEVVRAQGIFLMRQAVEEGLFDLREVGELIKSCRQHEREFARFELIRGFIARFSRTGFGSRSRIFANSLEMPGRSEAGAIDVIHTFDKPCSLEYTCNVIKNLFNTPMTLVDALGIDNKFSENLKNLIRGVHRNSFTAVRPVREIETFLLAMAGLRDPCANSKFLDHSKANRGLHLTSSNTSQPFQQHESENNSNLKERANMQKVVSGVLLSLVNLAQDELTEMESRPVYPTYQGAIATRAIRYAAIEILRSYANDVVLQRAVFTGAHLDAGSIVLVDIITLLQESRLTGTWRLEHRIKERVNLINLLHQKSCSADHRRTQIDRYTNLIADCCKTIDIFGEPSGFDLLKKTVYYLQKTALAGTTDGLLCNRLALGSTLIFRATSQRAEVAAFSDKLERDISIVRFEMQDMTPQLSHSVSEKRFKTMRWDEAFCEWVMATPAAVGVPHFESQDLEICNSTSNHREESQSSVPERADTTPLRLASGPKLHQKPDTRDEQTIYLEEDDNEDELSGTVSRALAKDAYQPTNVREPLKRKSVAFINEGSPLAKARRVVTKAAHRNPLLLASDDFDEL